MKWLRLTSKECNLLDMAVRELAESMNSAGKAPGSEERFLSYSGEEFTAADVSRLLNKVQIACHDKDSTD